MPSRFAVVTTDLGIPLCSLSHTASPNGTSKASYLPTCPRHDKVRDGVPPSNADKTAPGHPNAAVADRRSSICIALGRKRSAGPPLLGIHAHHELPCPRRPQHFDLGAPVSGKPLDGKLSDACGSAGVTVGKDDQRCEARERDVDERELVAAHQIAPAVGEH